MHAGQEAVLCDLLLMFMHCTTAAFGYFASDLHRSLSVASLRVHHASFTYTPGIFHNMRSDCGLPDALPGV